MYECPQFYRLAYGPEQDFCIRIGCQLPGQERDGAPVCVGDPMAVGVSVTVLVLSLVILWLAARMYGQRVISRA